MLADSLLDATGYEVVRFADLPPTHQKAIIWYMAIDGEAWEQLGAIGGQRCGDMAGLKRAMEEALPQYVERFADVQFGIATIPSDMMKDAIANSPSFVESYPTMDAFLAENIAKTGLHAETDRWPAILSGFDDEILQDGWKRCFSYLGDGHAHVPVIFYPERHHLERASAATPGARSSARPR